MKKLLKALDIFEHAVSMTGFSLMFVVVTVNVFSRYVLNKSFNWAEEISYLCFVWSVFMGVCILYKKQGLICIDVLVNRMSPGAQRAVRIFTFALLIAVNTLLMVYGYRLADGAWIRPTAALRIPYFFLDMAPTVGFAIMLFYSVRFLALSLQNVPIEEQSLEDRA